MGIFNYLLMVIVITTVSSTPIKSTSRELRDYLLPVNIIPIHYEIALVPILEDIENFAQFTYAGAMNITVIVAKAYTNMIQMHAHKDVNITSIQLSSKDEEVLEISPPQKSNDDRQFLTFNTNKTLTLGMTYKITIMFNGILNDKLYGFYRSDYQEKDGENIITKYLAVTQFESTGARWAFPCWDEPYYKATFTIHIANDIKHEVLSNMPVAENPISYSELPLPPSWKYTSFTTSVPMSTYLVAFAVSEFDFKENEIAPVTYKAWARKDLVQYAELSNTFAPKAIQQMELYTGHDYSLSKLDQIAVPDFAAGAMENWGLVTYREPYMLYNETVSTTSHKMGVISIVSHELAHQWFGNLVSPTWWSHIWLNEGFATYFTYYIMNKEYPQWKPLDSFAAEIQSAFQFDARESTHPMYNKVDSPSSINSGFDTIAYSKGASIIRMMEHTLGATVFQNGIKSYLTEKQFGNANKDDLWYYLESAIPTDNKPNRSVAEIMDTWVVQSGYPVITVTRDYTAKTAKATQKRFFTLPSAVESSEIWWVPLTMTTKSNLQFDNTSVQIWHSGPELTIGENFNSSEWLILNIQQVGYYRVNYDIDNWRLIIGELNNHNSSNALLHAVNRAQLLDDAQALARATLLDYPTAFDSTAYLARELEYTPWATGLSATTYVYDRLAYIPDDRYMYEYYMLGRLKPVYKHFGNLTTDFGTDDLQNLLRSLIASWTCKLNDEQCNNEASAKFNSWMNQTYLIHPDLKDVVYCAGIREGNITHYEFLEGQYLVSQYKPGETSLILNALSCSTNLTQIEIYLNESIKETSKIRQHDARNVLTSVYNNYLAVDLALNFFYTNYEACKNKYGQSGTESVFAGMSKKLNTDEHLNKLIAFGNYTLEDWEKKALDGAIKEVEEILAWHAQHYDTVTAYFRSKMPPPSGVSGLLGSPLLALCAVMFAVIFGRP